MAGIKLRKEVREFAEEMELALQANAAKKGESWKKLSPEDAIQRLRGEVDELEDATVYRNRPVEIVKKEGADVGNFAMFIVQNRKRKAERLAAKKAAKTSDPREEE